MRGWSLVPLLALAACQTETMERDSMGLWKQGDSASSSGSTRTQDAPKEEPRGTVVTIPADVVAQQTDFVNRRSTIFGDAVEVDLSRNGWLALATFAVSKDAVTRRDQEDAARGVLTITFERNTEVAATPDSIPTVRFGDGMRVVGIDRVVLRFWTQQSADRPQWFHAVAAGKTAVFSVESEPPQEWRGTRVDVQAQTVKSGGAYRFVSDAGAKP